MNTNDLFHYLSTKTSFPDIQKIFKRLPFIFLLTFIVFFVAEPLSIFAEIPKGEQWKLYLGYPTIAVFTIFISWAIFHKIIPTEYKKKQWSQGKSLAIRYIIAFLVLSSFHFYTKILNFHSSLEFFYGVGFPLAFFPALYFILVEAQQQLTNKGEEVQETKNIVEYSTSKFIFAETQAAFIKRWDKPQVRRNQVIEYYDSGEKIEWKISKFDTLEELLTNESEIKLLKSHKSYCINPTYIQAGIGNSKKFSVIMSKKGYEVAISREETDAIIAHLQKKQVPIFPSLQAYGKPIIPIWQVATHSAE